MNRCFWINLYWRVTGLFGKERPKHRLSNFNKEIVDSGISESFREFMEEPHPFCKMIKESQGEWRDER